SLSDTRFQTPVGPVALTRSIALDYRNLEQKISIGPHCWTNPNAELCVPETIDAGASGRARVNLNRFDLAMLKPFMPEATQASGVFTGNA
ncbi:translocation/assembly module TamB, partial [Acinetobacter baumannii]|nr:translocation/assembly module TamB [Acinetobacter baumannii]